MFRTTWNKTLVILNMIDTSYVHHVMSILIDKLIIFSCLFWLKMINVGDSWSCWLIGSINHDYDLKIIH
jgi:hypothetical protein